MQKGPRRWRRVRTLVSNVLDRPRAQKKRDTASWTAAGHPDVSTRDVGLESPSLVARVPFPLRGRARFGS